jgi:DNA-directed RNA polymerase subunit RPC12/RpoP
VKARKRARPRSSEPASAVTLQGATYVWTCPKCGAEHTGSALSRRVVCPECEHVFLTLGTRDEFEPQTFGFATEGGA